MYIDFKKIFSVLLILFIGAVIGIGIVKSIESFKAPKQTVSVTGTGEVDALTDQANVTIEIKNTSTTHEKAQEENKRDVDNLKSELKKLGIPESRITVSSYSQPIFMEEPLEIIDYNMTGGKVAPMRPTDRTASKTVTTNITLVLDPIKNIEKIYDLVSKNSNAQITNTYYSVKNRKTWETKAKEEALKDARSQVESIAKINRLRVRKLLTVEDGDDPRVYPMTEGGNNQLKDVDQTAPFAQEEVVQLNNESVYYSEQTVKISSSYTATYELY